MMRLMLERVTLLVAVTDGSIEGLCCFVCS